MFLTACKTVPVTKTEYVFPPEKYFNPCPVTKPTSPLLGYLAVEYNSLLLLDLENCNNQLKAGRVWLENAKNSIKD